MHQDRIDSFDSIIEYYGALGRRLGLHMYKLADLI